MIQTNIYDTPKVPKELVSNYLYFNILITQVIGRPVWMPWTQPASF